MDMSVLMMISLVLFGLILGLLVALLVYFLDRRWFRRPTFNWRCMRPAGMMQGGSSGAMWHKRTVPVCEGSERPLKKSSISERTIRGILLDTAKIRQKEVDKSN